jgi:hypothetical protein
LIPGPEPEPPIDDPCEENSEAEECMPPDPCVEDPTAKGCKSQVCSCAPGEGQDCPDIDCTLKFVYDMLSLKQLIQTCILFEYMPDYLIEQQRLQH